MISGRSDQVLAVAIVFAVLSWTATILRAIVRAGMLRKYGLDDWTMLITQLFFTAYLVCQIGGVVYGTGQHMSDLEPARAGHALKFWFFCEIFYIIGTAMMKISICVFLLRVSSCTVHIWLLRGLAVFGATCGLSFLFVFLFQCSPIDAWWSLDPHADKCFRVDIIMGVTYGVSGLIVVADWCLAILPVFIVKGLPMEPKQRMLVAFLLAFAALGSTATIVRLPYVGTLSQSYKGRDGDFLYDTVGVAVWTTVELGIGITAGCLATLRPLFRRIRGHPGTANKSRSFKTISSPIPLDTSIISDDLRRKGYQSFPSPDSPGVSQEQLTKFDFDLAKLNATAQLEDIEYEDEVPSSSRWHDGDNRF